MQELVALRQKAMDYLQRDGQVAADAYFCAEQNALVVRDAEEYYRNMFRREFSSWNLRDTHMMESLVSLADHLSKQGSPAKIIVWAHNSHLGDARATQMSERGEFNLGQLVRERFGKEAVLIGFTTYEVRSRRHRIGTDQPSARRFGPGIPKVTKRSSTRWIFRVSISICETTEAISRRTSHRTAGASHRRDLSPGY